MDWTKIDKDDESTWPTGPGLEMCLLWEHGDDYCEFTDGLEGCVRRGPRHYHGDFWAPLPPNPHTAQEPAGDDGMVEVRIAVGIEDDGTWYAFGDSACWTDVAAKEVSSCLRDEHSVCIVTARVPKYAPTPTVEVEGVVES